MTDRLKHTTATGPTTDPAARRPGSPDRGPGSRPSMAVRYETLTHEMLDRYRVRVRKWRTSMSGCAWEVTYRDGTVSRLIEAPRPKGPMSAAVFLHEIGHHAIGFHAYKPRCVEEYYAWAFALSEMNRNGISITDNVKARVYDALHYAVQKAKRRGLKDLPPELVPYEHPRRK